MRKAHALAVVLLLPLLVPFAHANSVYLQQLNAGGVAVLDSNTNQLLLANAPLDLISIGGSPALTFGGFFDINTGVSTGMNSLGPTYSGGELQVYGPGSVGQVFDGMFSFGQLQYVFDPVNNVIEVTFYGTLNPAQSMFLGQAAWLNPLASGTVANASIMINAFTNKNGDVILQGYSNQTQIQALTPEPASMTLLFAGLGFVGLRRKFRA